MKKGVSILRNQEIFVSLDIGTTSIKVVVAEAINGQVNIIGVGNEKSRGLSRGVIVDIDEAVISIRKAIAQAERKANVKINEVIVGIPSNKLNIDACHGMVAVESDNREIQAKDVENVIAAAKVRAVPPEREIVAIIPEEFIVDGFNGIRDPRGMIGVRLELYARLLTGPKTIIHNIKQCVHKAGLQITELVLHPQAIATVALTEDERTFGTVVIDMGGGQTSASIIYDNQLKYSFVDQEGGDYVTKDISVILNTSLDSAERVKREFGYALSSQTSSEEYFSIETVGKKDPVQVDEHYLSEIIEARLDQIFETIYEDLKQVDALDLPGGFVLTGGGAALPGVEEMAKKYFGNKVKVFIPAQMGMRNPIFSTGMGMVEYTANLDDIHRIAQGSYRGYDDFSNTEEFDADYTGHYPVETTYDEGYSTSGTTSQSSSTRKIDSVLGGLFNRPIKKESTKPRTRFTSASGSYDEYINQDLDETLFSRESSHSAPYDTTSYSKSEKAKSKHTTHKSENQNNLKGKLNSFLETFFD